MIRFECDYGEGAAQPVLDLLQKTNLEQTPGYGMDDYCDQARGLIRKLCDAPDAGVHFFVGATQANFTVVDALLKPWQGVLCADSGHINVHETGAVEATGHKCPAQRAGQNYRPAGEGCLRRSLGRCQPRAHCPARHGVYLQPH